MKQPPCCPMLPMLPMLPHVDWSVQSADDPSMSIATPILNSSQKGTNVWKQPSLFPSCWVIPKTSSAWCNLAMSISGTAETASFRDQSPKPLPELHLSPRIPAASHGAIWSQVARVSSVSWRDTAGPGVQKHTQGPAAKELALPKANPPETRWCRTMTNHMT